MWQVSCPGSSCSAINCNCPYMELCMGRQRTCIGRDGNDETLLPGGVLVAQLDRSSACLLLCTASHASEWLPEQLH